MEFSVPTTERSRPEQAKPRRQYPPQPLPELHSIHQGQVKKVADFGAFIEVQGFRRHGLCHISQLAKYKVENVKDAVDEGEHVWVKVVTVDTDENRFGVSMRVVDQTTGRDLDPTHLESTVRPKRRGDANQGFQATSDAVLPTVCRKCGCRGHFEWDCFNKGGDARYELLPPLPGEEAPVALPSQNKRPYHLPPPAEAQAKANNPNCVPLAETNPHAEANPLALLIERVKEGAKKAEGMLKHKREHKHKHKHKHKHRHHKHKRHRHDKDEDEKEKEKEEKKERRKRSHRHTRSHRHRHQRRGDSGSKEGEATSSSSSDDSSSASSVSSTDSRRRKRRHHRRHRRE